MKRKRSFHNEKKNCDLIPIYSKQVILFYFKILSSQSSLIQTSL